MRSFSFARVVPLVCGAALAVVVSACSDSRLRELEVGMTKDSVFKLVGVGAPAGDTLPNMYKHTRYLTDGKLFDIYFFEPKNRKIWLDPEVTDKELTPIVIVDSKLAGTGWGYMDGLTEKFGIAARAEPK